MGPNGRKTNPLKQTEKQTPANQQLVGNPKAAPRRMRDHQPVRAKWCNSPERA